MKFKYKKMVLMITMGTMFIGCVIFSTVSPDKQPVSKKVKAEVETTVVVPSAKPVESKKPAPDTTVIQKDLEPKVTEVVKKYLEASVKCDMEALEEIVNNIKMIDEAELKLKYEYVESANNIECYMIPSPDKTGYLVYIYRELKLKDIDTLAPAFSRVYVTSGESGEYRVFFGADTGLEEFINQTDNSKEVKDLVEKVNKKMQEAQSADADLDAFIKKITVDEKAKEPAK